LGSELVQLVRDDDDDDDDDLDDSSHRFRIDPRSVREYAFKNPRWIDPCNISSGVPPIVVVVLVLVLVDMSIAV
jgi:hypothetical protein